MCSTFWSPVDKEVGGDTLGAVAKPLEDVAVGEGGDPHRLILVVHVGVVLNHRELADQVGKLPQLAVAETLGGGFIQHRDLVVGDFLNINCEVTFRHRQDLRIVAGAQNGTGYYVTYQNPPAGRCR